MNIDLSADFDTKFLLAKLTENLETHKKEYEEARAGFFIEVQEQIEALQADMSKHPDAFVVSRSFRQLSPPESHTADYERAISMLSACQDAEIELDSEQYGAFVENQWTWRQNWTISNSAYISKSREVSMG